MAELLNAFSSVSENSEDPGQSESHEEVPSDLEKMTQFGDSPEIIIENALEGAAVEVPYIFDPSANSTVQSNKPKKAPVLDSECSTEFLDNVTEKVLQEADSVIFEKRIADFANEAEESLKIDKVSDALRKTAQAELAQQDEETRMPFFNNLKVSDEDDEFDTTISDITAESVHEEETPFASTVAREAAPTSAILFEADDLREATVDEEEKEEKQSAWGAKLDKLYDLSLSDVARLTLVAAKRGAMNLLDKMKTKKILKLFANGQKVQAGDFLFSMLDNELMLLKYSGTNMRIEIPSSVGNLPVTYLHPDFLVGGVGIRNNYKVRGLKSYWNSSDVFSLDLDSVKEISSGATEIILPKTIKALLKNTFIGCKKVTRLCIPESVKYVSPKAFRLSKVTELYFDGECPSGLRFLKHKCSVFARAEHLTLFKNELVEV